jgi:ABC-type nitrate/sulfonate/bicarbonate transport system substrate-binding protein
MTALTEPVSPRSFGARPHPSGLRELAVARTEAATASPVAALLGRFADEFGPDGITVSFLPPAEDALVYETGVLDTLRRHERGVRTRLVGLAWVDTGAVIVGRRSSAEHGPPALRGRRLALPTGAGDPTGARRAHALRAYESTLGLVGLGLRDVTLVPVDANAVDAIAAGEVDATYLPQSLGADVARARGIQVLVDLNAYPDVNARVHDLGPLPITVRTELLEAAPDVVARYLAAVLDASAWAAARGEHFRRLIRLCDGAFPIEQLTHDVHHRLHIDLSRERLGLLAAQQRFLLRHGFVHQGFDLVDWADPAPLGTARDLLAGRRYGHARP